MTKNVKAKFCAVLYHNCEDTSTGPHGLSQAEGVKPILSLKFGEFSKLREISNRIQTLAWYSRGARVRKKIVIMLAAVGRYIKLIFFWV